MFENMMEMMGKLKGLQDKCKDMKERLDSEEFIAKDVLLHTRTKIK